MGEEARWRRERAVEVWASAEARRDWAYVRNLSWVEEGDFERGEGMGSSGEEDGLEGRGAFVSLSDFVSGIFGGLDG